MRICVLISALNKLDLQSAYIENTYLTASCREKIWARTGPNFGHDEGKLFIVVKALYGLKSSGESFRAFLTDKIDGMVFTSSIADPDVWISPAKKTDVYQYYKYILMYVDDLLKIIQYAASVIREVADRFKLKNGNIEPPEISLACGN